MGVRKSKTGAGTRTRAGRTLEAGAREILAHVEGTRKLPTRRIVLPELEETTDLIRGAIRMHLAGMAEGGEPGSALFVKFSALPETAAQQPARI
jgi:hypothetical protein